MTGTDEQIRDGYEQLTSALMPPHDATERVAQRIAQRRRMRRAGVAACAAAVVAAAVGTAALIGGGDGTGTVADDPTPGGKLVMNRPDGSTYSFDDITVECGRGAIGTMAVLASTPRHMEGERMLEPLFYFEVSLSDLEIGHVYELPLKGPTDKLPLVVFVADAGTSDDGNEASSSEPGAAGTVRVLEASCEPVPNLRVELEATLGSEVDQGTLDVAGTLG